MQKKGLVIAGLTGGSGKSVIAVGITAALVQQGHKVATFKKGPDYIDAGWLQLAAKRKSYNLDLFLMSKNTLLRSFSVHSNDAEYIIVEGSRGLFDGVDIHGGYSTAELVVSLNLPVILVVNCTKITRTLAAMVLGCQQFDKRIDIKGVILNQVATNRQRRLVIESIEKYTQIPVIGSIPRQKRDIFPMRHLGVVPHQEYMGTKGVIDFLAKLIAKNIDLKKLKSVMAEIGENDLYKQRVIPVSDRPKLRIGILYDMAFQFYYSENLEALERAGGELVYVNAMHAKELPDIDGLYIGGGFPEMSAQQLAANASFRRSVYDAAEDGLPIYAECGGLIYLGSSIIIDSKDHDLVGVFPIRFTMSETPQAHGYTIFQVEKENAFYDLGMEVRGHEFRYSKIIDWRGTVDQLALKMVKGRGFVNGWDGLIYKNVFALYTHIHADGTPEWAGNFIRQCWQVKDSKVSLSTRSPS